MAVARMSDKLRAALGSVVERLSFEGEQAPPLWLLGGSSGLLLHDVPLMDEPRDIDLYADLDAADRLHEALCTDATDQPQEDFSRGCFSLVSHYRIREVTVELVCGFQICCGQSKYTVETGQLISHAPVHRLFGMDSGLIRLMPLAHEFIFNVLRGRADRCEQISSVMKKDMPRHLPLLQCLMERNKWEHSHITRLVELLGIPSLLV